MLIRCSAGAVRLRRLLAGSRTPYLGAHAGRRTLAGVVETLAKAAVNQALDRAILKDRLGSFSVSSDARAVSSSTDASAALVDDGTADVETWRAIVDQPLVRSADSVELKDLLLVSNDMTDVLDLSAHPGASTADPFALVADDLRGMNASIRAILGVDHPVLAKVAQYFFAASGAGAAGGGKKIRPAMVLLMSHAVNQHAAAVAAAAGAAAAGSAAGAGSASSSASAPSVSSAAAVAGSGAASPLGGQAPAAQVAGARLAAAAIPQELIYAQQRRLAEITEMIHTASLLHDDVIDVADTRRGVSSVNSVFGNKLAILAGDFLLARASVCLARLRNVPVVELLSTVIEHLVKGEVMQMRAAIAAAVSATPEAGGAMAALRASAFSATADVSGDDAFGSAAASASGGGAAGKADGSSVAALASPVVRAAFAAYLRKSYYKTSSLMANSCRAIALLGRYPPAVAEVAFRYGMHAGMAFQLVDDMLDFQGHAAVVGKPVLNDIAQGLATAPVLFAAQRFPVLLPVIERKFEAPGDVDLVLKYVAAADGITATRRLAVAHAQCALDAIAELAPGPARTALAALVTKVINRNA